MNILFLLFYSPKPRNQVSGIGLLLHYTTQVKRQPNCYFIWTRFERRKAGNHFVLPRIELQNECQKKIEKEKKKRIKEQTNKQEQNKTNRTDRTNLFGVVVSHPASDVFRVVPSPQNSSSGIGQIVMGFGLDEIIKAWQIQTLNVL